MKIRNMEAERTDGRRTDMTKLIVAFRNFVNAPAEVHTEFCW